MEKNVGLFEMLHSRKMEDYCLKGHLPLLRSFIGTQEETEQGKGELVMLLIQENVSWGQICSAMVILNLVVGGGR